MEPKEKNSGIDLTDDDDFGPSTGSSVETEGDALKGYGTVTNYETHKGKGFWGNSTTGYFSDEEVNNMPG